jgi:hypothetical protein
LTDANKQCQHSAKLCLCQMLQARNGNREAWGLGVSAHTGPIVSIYINVLLEPTEATRPVIRRGSGDTQSQVVLTLPNSRRKPRRSGGDESDDSVTAAGSKPPDNVSAVKHAGQKPAVGLGSARTTKLPYRSRGGVAEAVTPQ